MALWNPNKSPDKYPELFHFAATNLTPTVIAIRETRSQADHQRKRFNAFKASVRNYPLHRTARIINTLGLVSRAKITETDEGFVVEVSNRKNSISSLQSAIDSL